MRWIKGLGTRLGICMLVPVHRLCACGTCYVCCRRSCLVL